MATKKTTKKAAVAEKFTGVKEVFPKEAIDQGRDTEPAPKFVAIGFNHDDYSWFAACGSTAKNAIEDLRSNAYGDTTHIRVFQIG